MKSHKQRTFLLLATEAFVHAAVASFPKLFYGLSEKEKEELLIHKQKVLFRFRQRIHKSKLN